MGYAWETWTPVTPSSEYNYESLGWVNPLTSKREEALKLWEEANTVRENYLGGRTSGTVEEYMGWENLRYIADNLQRNYEAISSDFDAQAAPNPHIPEWYTGDIPSPLQKPENWAATIQDTLNQSDFSKSVSEMFAPPAPPEPVVPDLTPVTSSEVTPEPKEPLVDTTDWTQQQKDAYQGRKDYYQGKFSEAAGIQTKEILPSERTPFRGIRTANWADVDAANVAQGVKDLTNREGLRIGQGKTGTPSTAKELEGWSAMLQYLPESARQEITSSPGWSTRNLKEGQDLWGHFKPHMAGAKKGTIDPQRWSEGIATLKESGLYNESLVDKVNNWKDQYVS